MSVAWFQNLKKKYSKERETPHGTHYLFRRSPPTRVAHANTKLFVNKKDGFIRVGDSSAMKPPSPSANVLNSMTSWPLLADGSLKINKVAEKEFFGAELQHATIFQRGD